MAEVIGVDVAHSSDQTSIWIGPTWSPPHWWWSRERWAREGMRETQRLRRELVARGVSKPEARRLVPRISIRPEAR